ncbi:hypothetical protein KZP23_06420 [Echinicola marina]|uniref:hypothetical protein n=1 Tax=Echinicola marina TaxID=2859768 RepID=UPI001CF6D305|nr:hypothetical protein [Echinicola marina]UCS94644.1 hypothetical protein KZP23_06420 [Echinicola marina]
MKTRTQQFNQHYLVPLVLALGMVSLVFFLYAFAEYLNTPELFEMDTFYYYEGKGSWSDYQASQQFSSIKHMLTTAICIWAALAKNLRISILAIVISMLAYSF